MGELKELKKKLGKLKDKRKERREREEAEKELRMRFYEALVDEVDNWECGIKYKDFSGLIQFYEENKDIYLKFSKYYIPRIKAVKHKWTESFSSSYISLEGWIENVDIFMHLFEIREKLAELLNEAGILYGEKDFERALIYFKECIEGKFEIFPFECSSSSHDWESVYDYDPKVKNIYESIHFLGHTPFANIEYYYMRSGVPENREFYDSLDEKRKQVWDNLQKILEGKHIGGGTYRQNIEDMYDTKLKIFLEERIFEIESELEAIEYYKQNIDYLHSYLEQKKYNQAFNYYIKALSYRNKIKYKEYFLDEENEKKIEKAVETVILNLSNIIRKTVLDLSIKFTRLEIREIREECKVDHEDLVIKVIKEMIKNKEIYAEYFKSSNSILFNQQANIDEIDKLMDQYRQWEKEGMSKK